MLNVAARLAKVDLLSLLDAAALQRIVDAGTTISFRPGDRIVEQGKSDRSLQVVLDGTVVCDVSGTKVATLEAGAYFGETALIDHEPRSATITAGDEGAKVFIVSALAFEPLLDDPNVSRALLCALTRRVRQLEGSIVPS